MARSGRLRPDVLSAEARIVGALIAAFCWPLLCVRVTWLLLHRIAFATVASHVAAGAVILLILAFVSLVTRPVDRLRAKGTWVGTARIVASSFAAFVILAGVAGASLAVLFAPFALATFAAAVAEEAVFRRFLPDRLSEVLRRVAARPTVTTVAAVVIPQLSFAVAHVENSAFVHASVREFAALFVAGVLYQGVTRVGGLWAAAAVHAALNLMISAGRF